MSEATAMALETDAGNAAQDAPALYILNWKKINAPIPFDGREVIHTLRRPLDSTTIGRQSGVNESARFRAMARGEEIKEGKTTKYRRNDAQAYADLWGRCITRVVGYDGPGVELPLTDENKAELNPRHKELAVDSLAAYQTEFIPGNSRQTFKGGLFCIRAWQGYRKADDTLIGDFYVNFWSANQREDYKGSIVVETQTQGKATVTTYEVPIFETAKLYNALIDHADGVGIEVDYAVEPVSEVDRVVNSATREDLIKHTQILLKEAVIAEAILHWDKIAGN